MTEQPWYERMWTPARNAMEDEWHAAESSFACAVLGSLCTLADGRVAGIGLALLAFAVVIGVNGLWIAWWNRYALGGVLAIAGVSLGAMHIADALDTVRQIIAF